MPKTIKSIKRLEHQFFKTYVKELKSMHKKNELDIKLPENMLETDQQDIFSRSLTELAALYIPNLNNNMDPKNIVKKIAKVYKKPLEFMKEYVKDPEKTTHVIKRIIDQYLCEYICTNFSDIFKETAKELHHTAQKLDAIYCEWHDNSEKYAIKISKHLIVAERIKTKQSFIINPEKNSISTISGMKLNETEQHTLSTIMTSMNEHSEAITYFLDIKK